MTPVLPRDQLDVFCTKKNPSPNAGFTLSKLSLVVLRAQLAQPTLDFIYAPKLSLGTVFRL